MGFDVTVFSKRVIFNLDQSRVYTNIANRDYQGDAATSAVVKVTKVSDVTINDYTGVIYTGSLPSLTLNQLDLNISYDKSFLFGVDANDSRQWNAAMIEEAASKAAKGLDDTSDSDVGKILSSSVYTEGVLSAIIPTGSGAANIALNGLNALGMKLLGNKVKNGVVVITPEYYYTLQHADTTLSNPLLFAFANSTIGENGLVSNVKVQGMPVYVSWQVPAIGANKAIMAFSPDALTFAEGIPNRVTSKTAIGFDGEVFEGRYRYGALVTSPSSSALLPSYL